jgi:hypothetical protein
MTYTCYQNTLTKSSNASLAKLGVELETLRDDQAAILEFQLTDHSNQNIIDTSLKLDFRLLTFKTLLQKCKGFFRLSQNRNNGESFIWRD